ncbi:MAG: DUF192 domain-containing protein [Sphingomonas sp.]|jgi:hypothetical protein|uniref:DUF192 domain-containing protein n=1 Tax=Sphingomonas sp. TaxID=28214 RepID=UPI0035698368
MMLKNFAAALALSALALTACSSDGAAASSGSAETPATTIALTVTSSNGAHDFTVETAKTEAEQQRGLMFRTGIAPNAGMLFAPYPPNGGGPKEASFWMKNTPSPLDIIFIRADGTIATIAENTVPFSETPIPSGEPVAAVLEINGGRSAELGIAEGDKVTWAGHGK